MWNTQNIIVTTTPTLEGRKIIKYLKPLSSHIVAGTNLFSDFLGGLSDVFGGRSETYQKQLSSLYNESIMRIKSAAHEIGANGVVGLKIDIDEISGKGKSMFMISAVGTAVVFEKETEENLSESNKNDIPIISIGKIDNLRKRNALLKSIESKNLILDKENWRFLIENQIENIYPQLQKQNAEYLKNYSSYNIEEINEFNTNFQIYLNSLPREISTKLLYDSILNEQDNKVLISLFKKIQNLDLFNFDKVKELLTNNDFTKQKAGLIISVFDKPHYDKSDINNLSDLSVLIETSFPKRGENSLKKQMLSSKEKEIWICECGKSNSSEYTYCNYCHSDIYGFKIDEIKPKSALVTIAEKISLIEELVK